MNKGIRKELSDLKYQERDLMRGVNHVDQSASREIKKIQAGVLRELRIAEKQIARIEKRRAVLEGRLS